MTDGEPIGPRGLTSAFYARYELLAELGQGGMGAVYRGRDKQLDRAVAIKFLLSADAESRARFAREARTLARVQHANVTLVFEVGDDSGTPYLVSELVIGESLAALLTRHRRLDEHAAARIGSGVAQGLTAVHAIGVVHRDLKPGNVLIAPDGLPKICDFGLARSDKDEAVTRSGAVTGTPEFLAPELLRSAVVGPPADMYALGCMLYQLLEGNVPFPMRAPDGTSLPLLDIFNAHARLQPPPFTCRPAPSAKLSGLVFACLAKEAAARPTAAEAHLVLAACAAKAPVRSRALEPLADDGPVDSPTTRVVTGAQNTEPDLSAGAGLPPVKRASSSGRHARPRVAAVGKHVAPAASPPGGGARRMILGTCAALALLATCTSVMVRPRREDPPASTSASAAASTAGSAPTSGPESPREAPPIDASDPAHALAVLELRLKADPRRLSAADAAVAHGLPESLIDGTRKLVRRLSDLPDQPLPLRSPDITALALMLVRGGRDQDLAVAACARVLAGPPRPDEALLLELVARHADRGMDRLGTMLATLLDTAPLDKAALDKRVRRLLPPSRVLAMQARGELLAGRQAAARAIVGDGLRRYPESVMLAELGLLLGGSISTGQRWVWDAGGAEMVYVPPGPFEMGENSNAAGYLDAYPRHTVSLSGYFIDRFETSIEEYFAFYRWIQLTSDHRRCPRGACRGGHPTGQNEIQHVEIKNDGLDIARDGVFSDVTAQFNKKHIDHPVSGVNWFDAEAFARWTGRTLPTEAQWEKAARGTDGRKFPWGNDVPQPKTHAEFDQKTPDLDKVHNYPRGASPYGCFNMAGNVEEWCSDWYDAHAYALHRGPDPAGPARGIDKVRRGGDSMSKARRLAVFDRAKGAPFSASYESWGFRTAYGIAGAAPAPPSKPAAEAPR